MSHPFEKYDIGKLISCENEGKYYYRVEQNVLWVAKNLGTGHRKFQAKTFIDPYMFKRNLLESETIIFKNMLLGIENPLSLKNEISKASNLATSSTEDDLSNSPTCEERTKITTKPDDSKPDMTADETVVRITSISEKEEDSAFTLQKTDDLDFVDIIKLNKTNFYNCDFNKSASVTIFQHEYALTTGLSSKPILGTFGAGKHLRHYSLI